AAVSSAAGSLSAFASASSAAAPTLVSVASCMAASASVCAVASRATNSEQMISSGAVVLSCAIGAPALSCANTAGAARMLTSMVVANSGFIETLPCVGLIDDGLWYVKA